MTFFRTLFTATVSTLLLFAAAGSPADEKTAPPGCRYGAPDPAAPPELSQFAFLVGDFQVHLHAWKEDHWGPAVPGVTARWNGRYGLGGMDIEDEWFNPDLAQDRSGNRGVNVRIYDPDDKVWKIMWIATAGKTVTDLRARVEDGVLTLWQVSPERPDFKAIFQVDDADHWARISYTHDDKGNWVRQYKLAATRISCRQVM